MKEEKQILHFPFLALAVEEEKFVLPPFALEAVKGANYCKFETLVFCFLILSSSVGSHKLHTVQCT